MNPAPPWQRLPGQSSKSAHTKTPSGIAVPPDWSSRGFARPPRTSNQPSSCKAQRSVTDLCSWHRPFGRRSHSSRLHGYHVLRHSESSSSARRPNGSSNGTTGETQLTENTHELRCGELTRSRKQLPLNGSRLACEKWAGYRAGQVVSGQARRVQASGELY